MMRVHISSYLHSASSAPLRQKFIMLGALSLNHVIRLPMLSYSVDDLRSRSTLIWNSVLRSSSSSADSM